MKSALGIYFEQQRIAKGISFGQLPATLGYRNGNKARRRWWDFIATGCCTNDFLRQAATVFNVTAETINGLIEEDIQAWHRWADEPVKPYLVIRIIAAVYSHGEVPEGLTLEQAEAFASAKAKETGRFRVCLVWNRRLSVYFDKDGSREGQIESTPWLDGRPYMRLKGRKFLLGPVS